MGLFRHPCVSHGVVYTTRGGFTVRRGLVELPDELGEACGWVRVSEDDPATEKTPAPAGSRRPVPLGTSS